MRDLLVWGLPPAACGLSYVLGYRRATKSRMNRVYRRYCGYLAEKMDEMGYREMASNLRRMRSE